MDQVKSGRFIAEMRRDKGLTQEELGQRLGVSQKAVSRWETGRNMPDVGLLIPLAEALGTTVTEILEGRRLKGMESMSAADAEVLVKRALGLAETPKRGGPDRKRWGLRYILCLAAALTEAGILFCLMARDQDHWDVYYPAALLTGLAAGFGAYFCLLAKTRLPWYHDVENISLYYDGPLRMNVPGVRFNNRTWPHILRWVRAWCLLTMTTSGVLCLCAKALFGPGPVAEWLPMVSLAGLLAAVYVPGKKYA